MIIDNSSSVGPTMYEKELRDDDCHLPFSRFHTFDGSRSCVRYGGNKLVLVEISRGIKKFYCGLFQSGIRNRDSP